ncbi:MAG: T9SS type A sorting domain-containing protein [Bacteroidetes bacterium]|nr:T9SS type A sorting domain-containing protein [Bacteroidota bacterium]
MKKWTYLICGLLVAGALHSQSLTKDVVMRAWAEISRSPNKITLKWEMWNSNQSVYIFKKKLTEDAWTAVATLPANTTSYEISSPVVGEAMEYRIRRDIVNGSGQVTNYCNGYILTGLDVTENHFRGRLLVVVAKNINDSLAGKVGLCMQQISGDGWMVDSVVVPVSFTAPQVKARIKTWYDKAQSTGKAVFLLGHVAVPYSGLMNNTQSPMDGHTPDHDGAWVADGYYADVVDDYWTDNGTNTNATRNENKNSPSDGKWDQLTVPSDPELQVARVDMYNLPVFGKTEIELTARYLDKLTAFKYGRWNIPRRGLIDDRLGYFSGEAPARGAWMALSPAFGTGNITEAAYFTTLKTTPYLMAHECSYGGYTQYVNVGSTSDYLDSVKGVFNSSFGSYFGDWDVQNGILKGCLASPGYTLSNCWNGRPLFLYHHMALGENLGHCMRVTLNNYPVSGVRDFPYPVLYGEGRLHISLLGDPSLRFHAMKPVSNVVATPAGDKKSATITWTASPEVGVVGYNIYRAPVYNGKFEKINANRISGLTFTDNTPLQGKNIYMVRAVKLDSSASGTYYNQSIGMYAEATGLTGLSVKDSKLPEIAVFPNPSSDWLQALVPLAWGKSVSWQVSDIAGRAFQYGTMPENRSVMVNCRQLPDGVYLLRMETPSGESRTARFVVKH